MITIDADSPAASAAGSAWNVASDIYIKIPVMKSLKYDLWRKAFFKNCAVRAPFLSSAGREAGSAFWTNLERV